MANFEEQMRLFEAEVGQGHRPPAGGPKPVFMPASVRTHQGGSAPPPPTYARPGGFDGLIQINKTLYPRFG